jgi:hypothetical protein
MTWKSPTGLSIYYLIYQQCVSSSSFFSKKKEYNVSNSRIFRSLSSLHIIIVCSESFPTDILSCCNYTEQEPESSKPLTRNKTPNVTEVRQFSTLKKKNKLIYTQRFADPSGRAI